MADGELSDGLTSPRAVAAYVAIVAAVLLFQGLGWSPAALVGALLLLPWLSEYGIREGVTRRPAWWASHLGAAAALTTLAATAMAVQMTEGPWATPAILLSIPLAPVLIPAYWMLGTPTLGKALPHLPAAVAILTPVYGLGLHRLRLQRFEARQRRVRVARRRINAALKKGTASIEAEASDAVA